MSSKYEIRKMGARGLRHGYFCSGTTGRIACLERATLYLVRRAVLPMDERESRQRRCVACAAIDAKSLGIAMPEEDSNPAKSYPPERRRFQPEDGK